MRDRADLFWSKVQKGDGCWEWQGARNSQGYGRLYLARGRHVGAHRFSWTLHNGPVPDGMQVCHHCDNPPCCNPAHLFVGTALDNATDKVRKGRQKDGERHHSARLTLEQARSVLAEFHAGATTPELSAKYGISVASVAAIITGKTWRSHVPQDQTVPNLIKHRATCRICGARAHARRLCNRHYLQLTRGTNPALFSVPPEGDATETRHEVR